MRASTLARLLLVGGVASIVASASKVHAALNLYDYSNSPRLLWSLALVGFIVIASYGAGLPDLTRSPAEARRAATIVLALSGLGISAIQLFIGDALLPRFVVGASILLLWPWLVLCASLANRGRSRQEARDRVVLVGSEEDARALRSELAEEVEIPGSLVGHLAPAEVERRASGSLVALAERANATVVVLSREAQLNEEAVHQASILHERGLRVRTLSLFYEQWLGKLPVNELERVSLLYDISELHRAIYGRASRIADILLAMVGVIALAIAMPVVWLGNVIANQGPLLYRQARIGKNGVEFQIVKFRTMRPAGAEVVNEWTTEDDPRITRFGHVLRRTHVDELPQLLNILRGDLSLVGPRPEQPHYVDELTEKLPFYGLRHLVKPGLTGWAQVKYGYAGSETDALEKLQFEFYYLRHQSLSLDLRILFRTLRRVLRATGR